MSTSLGGKTIGFLGGGKMGGALAKGILAAKLAPARNIIVSEPVAALRAALAREIKVRTTDSNAEAVQAADIILLAVKPDVVPTVLLGIKSAFTPRKLLISVCAGVTLETLQSGLAPFARVIRVMPNTPALLGAGAAAFARGKNATAEDAELAQKILGAVGLVVELPEKLLDAVTGLSGSGPAYVFVMIEALSDGGVAMGLPRDVATRLAAQTVLGAAKMVLETGQHPGALKDAVASPGGTTIEGLAALEAGKVRAAFISAVRAATEKSKQLGQKKV